MNVKVTLSSSLKLLTLALFVVVLSNDGYSASQGSLGSTSSGSFGITLAIAPKKQVNIATTKALDSGELVTEAKFNQKEPVCVQGHGIDAYSLTATGSGQNGAFTIESDDTVVGYDVVLQTETETPRNMITGSPSQTINTTAYSVDCSQPEASISVNPKNDLQNESLTGALQITVGAE